MRFKLTGGDHIDHRGQIRNKGDIFDDPCELDKVFPNKFVRVTDESSFVSNVPPPPPSKTLPTTVHVPQEGDSTIGDPSKEGKDVTEKFPTAVAEDFKVFRHIGKYFVYNADNMSKVNPVGVAKAEVDGVIKGVLKE